METAKFGDERLPKRFWDKVTVVNCPIEGLIGPCWKWSITHSSYPSFSYPFNGKRKLLGAYVVAYLVLIGPYSKPLELDHLCKIKACVNPAHLEPVSRSTNLMRGNHWNRSKTHCKWGHPLKDDNLWINNRGDRVCKACQKIRASK